MDEYAKVRCSKSDGTTEKKDRENRNRMYASSVVYAQPVVSGFRLMDPEAEKLLTEILNQYNGNENNHVGFRGDNLPRSITENIGVQFEKLKLYGILASVIPYGHGGGIMTISDTAKTYFSDKEVALKQAEEEKIKLNRIDKDIAMSRIHKKYDVFISHASKDKEEYVNLLTDGVKFLGIDVFYDTDVISWGDNWKQVILNGTEESEFAVIVISKNFFGREWTEKELNEFLTRQNESEQKVVLPLLLGITKEEMIEHYPLLEEIQYIKAEDYSKEQIVILLAKELIKRYK